MKQSKQTPAPEVVLQRLLRMRATLDDLNLTAAVDASDHLEWIRAEHRETVEQVRTLLVELVELRAETAAECADEEG